MKVFAQQVTLPSCNILFAFLSRENRFLSPPGFVDFLLSVLMFVHSFIYADLLSIFSVPGSNSQHIRQTSPCSRGVDILTREIDNKEINNQSQLQRMLEVKSIKGGG